MNLVPPASILPNNIFWELLINVAFFIFFFKLYKQNLMISFININVKDILKLV